VFLLFSLLITHTLAWDDYGHEMVGTIAQMFLTPTTRSHVCEILPTNVNCHLAPLATWADETKDVTTSQFHYVGGIDDWPPLECQFPGPSGWVNEDRNVLVGVVDMTRKVQQLSGAEQDDALRHLIHYMGDLHMPFHLTNRDRGGNNDKVTFGRQVTNLHSVWDDHLVNKAIREMSNYTQPIPSKLVESALRGSIYDSYVRFIVHEGIFGWWEDEWQSWVACPSGRPYSYEQSPQQEVMMASTPSNTSDVTIVDVPACPMHWARSIHALNCPGPFSPTGIWPKHLAFPNPSHQPSDEKARGVVNDSRDSGDEKFVELDTPKYAGAIRGAKIVEKMLAMAGVRLAAVLNSVLDPDGISGLKVQY